MEALTPVYIGKAIAAKFSHDDRKDLIPLVCVLARYSSTNLRPILYLFNKAITKERP